MTRTIACLHCRAWQTDPCSARSWSAATSYLALLDARLAEAAAGRGRTVLLAGEAGIGKTRLIGAIVRRARELGFAGIQGDLAPHDDGVPAAVVLDLARTMRDMPAMEATGEAIVARWRAAVGTGAGDL